MELAAGGASDVGMVRSANEDSWLVADRLWAVADGMGGHQGGEVASQLGIEVLSNQLDEFTPTALVEATRDANAAVHERAAKHSELRGMGTTLCAMALIDSDEGGQTLNVINVGDSRCYRWRDAQMTQITRDHSLVEDLRVAGQITEAEAAVHPHRNIVTRALGIQPEVRVDSFLVTPATGDRYVLCSDGLFNEIPVDRIAATLRRLADPGEAAAELVRQANEAGGRDNVTCVVVDVVDDAGVAAASDGADGAVPVGSPSPTRSPDLAGITTALPVVDGDAAAAEKPRRSDEKAEPESSVRLRRATWRTLVFVLILIAILAVGALAVGWYSRGSYFVGLDGDQVTVFKGRPQSVLWFDPTVETHTGIAVQQVPETYRDEVTAGKEQSSRTDADAFVASMRSVICSDLRNGAEQPPLAPGAPTTTIPVSCREAVTTTTTTTAPTTTTPPQSSTP